MRDRTAGTIVRIPGRLQPDEPLWLASQIPADSPLFANAGPARAFRLGGTGVRGIASDAVTEVIPDDALVEIEFESGLRFWTSGDLLRERLQAAGGDTTRGGAPADADADADSVWDLPASIAPVPQGTRGAVGKLAIKALRWVGLDPVQAGMDKLVELAETRSVPREGLFRMGDDGILGDPLDRPVPDGARALILVHGTASNTRGSFSRLWLDQRKQWARLRAWFGERIYAFEHCTLSRGPIENALMLSRLLPRKGAVRFLTHSRGGLVGELLCLDPAEVDRAGIIATLDAGKRGDSAAQTAREEQQAQFFELMRELETRPELEIESFVRVACPVIGTTLLGQKLDQWFSLLVLAAIADEMRRSNNRGLVTSALGSLARYGLDMLAEITAGIVASRKKAHQLPGLEAQMPQSALVRILNGNQGRGQLFVVAGDAEPSEHKWLAELRFGLIDRYFEHDHDLVVDTRAMLDGPIRPGRKLLFRSGADVNHFSYFGNDDSAAAIAAALTDGSEARTVFYDYTGEWPLPEGAARGLFAPRPLADPPLERARGIVLLVPGLCGSELNVAGRDVWVSVLSLACGAFGKTLGIDNPAVAPGKPLAGSYLALANTLRREGYVVRMHGYDWRKSVLASADDLVTALTGALDDSNPRKLPVHAVVHSMGGVLIRAAFAKDKDLWQRWRDQPSPDARVLMLGTPNLGSHAVTLLFTARDGFFSKLALIDLHHTEAELLAVANLFPGVLELLPRHPDENGTDIRVPATWIEFQKADKGRWPTPPGGPLAKSAELWETLLKDDPLPAHERLIYVAGTAPETPVRATIGTDGKFHLLKTNEGDGRVTWASGIPPACKEGQRCYYMSAAHGDMPAHAEAYPALLDLLHKGSTSHPALSRQPAPPRARGALEAPGEYPPLGAADLSHFPSRGDLLAAATGATLAAARAAARPGADDRAAVRVIHGDLIYVDSPVLVGHKQGVNNLEQAEYVLNHALNGRMQRRLDAGIYAGPLKSFALFPRQPDESSEVGAIVIGIGRIGELSPGRLADGVARALAAYAITMLEEHDRRLGKQAANSGDPLELKVSALLIGTGVGEMSLRDSVAAILRGHRDARERLADASLDAHVKLCALDFIELLEDRAIQAQKAARDAVALDGELRRRFTVADTLFGNEGGRRRAFAEAVDGEWARIVINAVPIADGSGTQLLFDAYGDLARTERLYNGIPLASIERFTHELISKESDDEEVGRTLFELLLPHWLKEQAPDRRRAQLVLDAAAAAIPWELLRDRMADRSDRSGEPLSVRSGLVRQLSSGRFRQRVQRADGYHALVIGDPDLGAWHTSFPPLKGARSEAESIARLLNDGGYSAPTALLGSKAEPIQIALYKQDWRIMHLSGHGVYKEVLPSTGGDEPTKSAVPATGMLIGERSLLTPAHIEQMRVVPDFVFINCCSLGRIEAAGATLDQSRPGNPALAANLAAQLIEMGVRGVIAAGWRVLDDAAELFAKTFYSCFLEGETFGESVLAARRATYDRFPRSNTWGAYQCYGDPSLLLPRPPTSSSRGARPVRYDFVAPREVLAELERLSQQTRYHGLESSLRRKRSEESIDALARLCERHGWGARGDIHEAFGRLWGELGAYDRAIASYRAAQGAGDASASLKTAEQLVNMLARRGTELLCATGADTAEVQEQGNAMLSEAEALIDQLIAIAPNLERHCLKGSICKRRLKLTPDNELDTALQRMATAYQAAEQFATEPGGRLYYPALNVLQASLLRQLLGTLTDKELAAARARIAAVRAELDSPEFEITNIWDRVAALDLTLTELLFDAACNSNSSRALEAEFEEARRRYKELLAYTSRRERGSVTGTLESLAAFLPRLPPGRKGTHSVRARTLLSSLKTLADGPRSQ